MTKAALKALQAKWYQKLNKSGFRDIEDQDHPDNPLYHGTIPNMLDMKSPERYEERQRYYQLASQLYHSHKFDNARHKRVWYFYSEGLSLQAVAQLCGVHKNTVSNIIKKYEPFIKRVI